MKYFKIIVTDLYVEAESLDEAIEILSNDLEEYIMLQEDKE